MIRLLLVTLAAISLTVGPALIQGQYTNRWRTPPNLAAAGVRLHQLPRVFGDWQNSEDERPLSDAVCQELGLTEHFHRQYMHRSTGETVHVLLMVGPPGRLVRHPPDVCYANRANEQIGEIESMRVDAIAEEHQFKLLEFRRTAQPVKSKFQVAYAFNHGEETWNAPDSPRMAYGAASVLYKLQVLTEEQSGEIGSNFEDFLRLFVEQFHLSAAESEQASD